MMMLSRSALGRYRPRSSLLTTSNTRFYTDQRLTGLWNAPLAASSREEDDDLRASPLFQHQVRWKRKGGASAFSKPRPPTRKQQKAYNRRKAKLHHERVGKHSAPGSKAGYRRQFNEDTFQELLDGNKKDAAFDQQLLEYDYGDALVDDLMGNTSSITSIPTPTPRYLGHKHKRFYNRVQRKMDAYRETVQKLQDGIENNATSGGEPALPSDHDISLVMRAYRDRHGTKMRPIGIAGALKHLLTDLSLPTASFGEETYTTLLTCCRTPTEARRILRLMREQQHAISAYSWAILVDIHAKLGDFEGANAVLGEMVTEGVPPSLPAYTSLLAACYKVCNNGTIPHEVRDKAGKLGWSRWKEMRVMGLDPDVMAYGALLRLVAARGQPERAINILEEMQTMEVKPTTLCFTSALKAVSRSQQTAIRFERGSSKKNRRREQITSHHGKMARTIVIMAENAEVEQDDGFVAALMLCAGAAGDSATAKAILLASEVRRMDHLRSIGSNEHLRRLQGESVPSDGPLAMTGGHPPLYLPDGTTASDIDPDVTSYDIVARNGDRAISHSPKQKKIFPSFEEREYGKDTRKLSALLFSCSQAVESHGLGTQWAGRDSKGYLCANSLRLLTVRPQPKYYYPAIPGVSSTEVGMGSIDWKDENPEHLSKSLRRAKYMGINQDDSVGYTMDDIPEEFYNMFKDEYEEAQNKNNYMFKGEKAHNKDDNVDPRLLDKEQWEIVQRKKAAVAMRERKKREFGKNESSIEEASYKESDEEWYFDDDVMRWKTRKRQGQNHATSPSVEANIDEGESEEDNEMYFDDNIMRWSTRPKQTAQPTIADDIPSFVYEDDTVGERLETYSSYPVFFARYQLSNRHWLLLDRHAGKATQFACMSTSLHHRVDFACDCTLIIPFRVIAIRL
jgi:pentatricopeptide repeat protein